MRRFIERTLCAKCRRRQARACSPAPNGYAITVLAAALGAMLAFSPGAQAEVRVTGDRRSLQVEADRASIADVLAALRNAVGLNYRSAVRLDSPLTGRFAGSLDQVVVKALSSGDYSYVYHSGAAGPMLEIVSADPEAAGVRAAEPLAAGRPPLRVRLPGLGSRAPEHFDATEALMWDETLRRGDVIVTDEGVRVFEGSDFCPHAISDFRTLSETPELSRRTRTVLDEIERAMKIRNVSRVDRPIVAADPPALAGR